MESKIIKTAGKHSPEEIKMVGGLLSDEVWRSQGVSLEFEQSTSRARIFNLSLKLAALDWGDSTLDEVEDIIEARFLGILNGYNYEVEVKQSNGRHYVKTITCGSKEEARKRVSYGLRDGEVVAVKLTS